MLHGINYMPYTEGLVTSGLYLQDLLYMSPINGVSQQVETRLVASLAVETLCSPITSVACMASRCSYRGTHASIWVHV